MEEKTLDSKSILKKSFKIIYDSALYLLLFEILYKGLILIFFKPIINIIISLFIRAGGYEILVNGEISQFLLSFTGILMIIVVTSLAVVLVYYEFSVILLILDSSKKKEEIKLLFITERALLKLKNVIQSKNIGLAMYILLLIPILNIGIQSSLLPVLSIPDFITGEIAKYPGSGVLFFVLSFALMYLFAKLFLVLPLMVFSDRSFKEASKISFETIKGEGFKIALLIITGMIIWLILTYLPFMIVENVQFILLRLLRALSSASLSIFTLLISPFILSISLGVYSSYLDLDYFSRVGMKEEIELGYLGKKFWNILKMTLNFIQALLSKARNHKKMLIALTLALIIISSVYAQGSLKPIYDKQLLIGHRGGEYGVENTIDTIIFAGTQGADYVEMDILLTKDNVPVVIHDNNLRRLGKVSNNISDMTLEEVKRIRIWGRGKEDSIPSLEELSKEVKGKTKLLLEFKSHGKEKVSIVDQVIKILEKEGILEDTIFHTSEKEIIKEFNEKHEELSIGYVFIGKIGTFSARKMARMPVDFISAEESLIDKKMIRAVHKAGKAVFAWTINDDYKAKRLFELGVDGIITDYPVEMLELRDRYRDYMQW